VEVHRLFVVSDLLGALQNYFTLKDLGSLHYFLGIEVTQTRDGLQLSQKSIPMICYNVWGWLHVNLCLHP
jgi:hypothetical protein